MRPRPFPYEHSSYPFSDTSTFQLDEETRFPTNFLSDAHIYVTTPTIHEITRVIKSRAKLTFFIGTPLGPDIISGEYNLPYDEVGTDFRNTIDLFDQFGRRAGVLVIDIKEAFLFVPDGNYELDYGSVKFEVSCHISMSNDSVSGFIVN